jgi:hypothetical protein
MDPTPAELPPGCLVLLLRLSAGMTADVVTGRGEIPAFVAARFLADELLDGLVNTVSAGYEVGAIDVAVLGYRTAEDGSPQLFSLLPDGDVTPRLVPLAQVAEMPAVPREAEGQPKKWAVLPPCEGEACPVAALARVYQMVSVWLTGRFAARPPVVIHCTAADAIDDAYFRVARSFGLLATGYGPVRLIHQVFDAGTDPVPTGAWTAPPDAELWAELFHTSGELPENADAGKLVRRAIAVNDWDITDHWDAIFTSAWREDTVAWVGSGGFSRSREMWAQKMGNTPEQWEDAFAVDTPGGAVVVADGASTGIYCSIWAQQLSQRFLSDRPDTREPISLNKWVNGLRTEWRTAINYSNLNWSKQAKVDQVGAAATLLTLETGPQNEHGERPWRACAVGDASLFWVRGGRLLATFPVVAADQFGSAPLLVRSNPGFKTLAVAAAGTCQPGDRFVLATDAVASRLFKSAAVGPGPEWGRFETISQDAWRAELDTLRQANDMVNDDCTLVVLRVAGGPDEPAPDVVQEIEVATPSTAALWLDEPESAEDVSPTEQPDVPEREIPEQQSEQDAPAVSNAETGAIPADVGDLLLDIPHDPPADESVEEPKTSDEPPPTVEPPAARDGFSESTDPRD